MSLTLEAGISARNQSLREHMAQRIYSEGLTGIAGKIDLSPSRMSEKLAGGDSSGKVRGQSIDVPTGTDRCEACLDAMREAA